MSKDTVYTAEVLAGLVERYSAVMDEAYEVRSKLVAEMADELGVTVPSLRGKLVSAGVYKSQEKAVEANGEKGLEKADYIKALEALTGQKLTSFGNATKKDLRAVFEYVRDMALQYEVEHPTPNAE